MIRNVCAQVKANPDTQGESLNSWLGDLKDAIIEDSLVTKKMEYKGLKSHPCQVIFKVATVALWVNDDHSPEHHYSGES